MRVIARKLRKHPVSRLAMVRSAPKRFAYAIRSTGSLWPGSRVLYAGGIHPRELHREGDEVTWWGKLSIDPLPVALRLWQHTRLNGDELAPSENITPSQAAQKLARLGRAEQGDEKALLQAQRYGR